MARNEKKYQELLIATASHEMRTPLNSIISMNTALSYHVKSKEAKQFLRA